MLKNASTQCHGTEEFSRQHKTFQNVNSYINYDMEDIALFQGLHPSLCHCNKFHTASDKAGGGGPGSGPEKVIADRLLT